MGTSRASELCAYFEKVRARTRRVADCIPADRLEWTWAPGKFTLGDILRHLAGIERDMFAENVSGRQSRYSGCGREFADGVEAVRAYIDRCHAESMAIFGALSDEDFERTCQTPGGVNLRIGSWLRLMTEHEIHHRGQLYMALGILGVATPPIYGLTSEQVLERSLPRDSASPPI